MIRLGHKANVGHLFGRKSIHQGAALGTKAFGLATALAPAISLVAPEVGVPLMAGASAGLAASRGIEKVTSKKG